MILGYFSFPNHFCSLFFSFLFSFCDCCKGLSQVTKVKSKNDISCVTTEKIRHGGSYIILALERTTCIDFRAMLYLTSSHHFGKHMLL